jgi:replicative DNA helicase
MAGESKRNQFIDQQEAKARFLKWLNGRENLDSYFRSGFKTHDQRAGAFQRGALYVVASRPGIGKTATLLSLAYHQAIAGVSTYFSNLEMPTEQLWLRLACIHRKDLKLWNLLNNELSLEHKKILNDLAENELVNFAPVFTDEYEFTEFVKIVHGSIKPGSRSILFIDYLGLFSMKGLGAGDRYAVISDIARQLKLLAKHLEIPIVAAVQLNRNIENRKEKAPALSDLADSGDIEKHADAVFILTRENEERLDVHVKKNRNGPVCIYDLSFDGLRVAVEDFD